MSVAYIGRVEKIEAIEGADRIVSATVQCGDGGNWIGVVQKGIWNIGDECTVFLQDAIVPKIEGLEFLDKSNRRVRIAKFKGSPSECVIHRKLTDKKVGDAVDELLNVEKYEKHIPQEMRGHARGNFPPFLHKTDEPNFQTVSKIVEYLKDKPCYASLKYDGTSCTVYKYGGQFGVCSRNFDLQDGDNLYWNSAKKYDLENKLPDGFAVQYEIYGNGIPKGKNPVGIDGTDIAIFNVYSIKDKIYYGMNEMIDFCSSFGIPHVDIYRIWDAGHGMDSNALRKESEAAKYSSGNISEGIVIRSMFGGNAGRDRLSFKVLNPLYKD